MNVKPLLMIIDWLLGFCTIWIIYVHIYGVDASLYRENKKGKKYIKPSIVIVTLFYLIPSLFFEGKWTEDERAIGLMITMQVICFFGAKQKKIQNSFWFYPIMLVYGLPIVILELLLQLVGISVDTQSNMINILETVYNFSLFFVLYRLDKKYNFSKRVHKREKLLSVLIPAFITMAGLLLIDGEFSLLPQRGNVVAERFLFLAMSITLLVLYVRIISVGTFADYYEELSVIHEKNARETLAFYESYKEAQTETRKLRHDMKNHFACIQILAEEEKYEQLQRYLEDFNEAVSQISMEIQTGNDIIDAILNVKAASAKKEGIEFVITGTVPYMPFIDAMDWCKIISNGVDNGIEALRKCKKEGKQLRLQFLSRGNFLCIHMENDCEKQVEIHPHGIVTEKKDKRYHGLGIKNIETAVKKYDGELQLVCEEREGGFVFILDALLPQKQRVHIGNCK